MKAVLSAAIVLFAVSAAAEPITVVADASFTLNFLSGPASSDLKTEVQWDFDEKLFTYRNANLTATFAFTFLGNGVLLPDAIRWEVEGKTENIAYFVEKGSVTFGEDGAIVVLSGRYVFHDRTTMKTITGDFRVTEKSPGIVRPQKSAPQIHAAPATP